MAEFRLFLSAVSSEFAAARDTLAASLRAREMHITVQSDFRQQQAAGTTPFTHMVPPGIAEASYTQWELVRNPPQNRRRGRSWRNGEPDNLLQGIKPEARIDSRPSGLIGSYQTPSLFQKARLLERDFIIKRLQCEPFLGAHLLTKIYVLILVQRADLHRAMSNSLH
jgi:hypothetical protein